MNKLKLLIKGMKKVEARFALRSYDTPFVCNELVEALEYSHEAGDYSYVNKDVKVDFPLFGKWIDKVGKELNPDEYTDVWVLPKGATRRPSIAWKYEKIQEFVVELEDRELLVKLLKEVLSKLERCPYEQQFLCSQLANKYAIATGTPCMISDDIRKRFPLFGAWIDKIGFKLNPGFWEAWTTPTGSVSMKFKAKVLRKFIKKLECK